MRFLLDTDTCIYIIKKIPQRVLRHFETLSPGDVGISAITLSELVFGVEKSARPAQNREALESFVAPLEVAPYDHAAAASYGSIRAALAKSGKMIGNNDLLIAAHAVSLNIPLVTNNVREFKRVHGLKVENWA